MKHDNVVVVVVIVGSGFAGLFPIRRLREPGFRFHVAEAAGDVGGTWYFNHNPARAAMSRASDSPSR